MRFQEVSDRLLQFEAVRGACSRRWRISDALVMCTELDLAGYAALLRIPLHSTRRSSGPSFLRISFVRRISNGHHSWTDCDGARGDPLTSVEQSVVATYRVLINEWIAGDRSGLPPSTAVDGLRERR